LWQTVEVRIWERKLGKRMRKGGGVCGHKGKEAIRGGRGRGKEKNDFRA